MEFSGFDWDVGNIEKCGKHGVSVAEIESVFELTVHVAPDPRHSATEERFKAIGMTRAGRKVFLAFTVRRRNKGTLIRPISARYMHEKEIKSYEEEAPGVEE